MTKSEIYEEILKLEKNERKDLFGALFATFTAEELADILKEKAPEWIKTSAGKVITGIAIALCSAVAGYFINRAGVQIPYIDDVPAIEAPATVEQQPVEQ